MHNNGQDLNYCDLNSFCIESLFHYTGYDQNLKYDKKTDAKLVLTNILFYLYHKTSTE